MHLAMNRLSNEIARLDEIVAASENRGPELRAALMFYKQNNYTMSNKEYLKFKNEIVKRASQGITAQQSLLTRILEEVFKELDMIIWKTNKDGIVRDKDGNPKVDWMKVFFNIGKIVGAIFAIREQVK